MKVRIIPTILTDGQTVVKGTQFNNWRTVGMAQAVARLYAKRDVDELMFIDVKASERNSTIPESLFSCFTDLLNIPFSVGGGVNSLETATRYLGAGAEKVLIGRAAFSNPKLISEIAHKFGSQAVIVAIDVLDNNKGELARKCGKDPVSRSAIKWAKELESLGAGELLLQSVVRDGEMSGMDYPAIREVTSSVNLPVIASGGAKNLDDCLQAVNSGASALAIGALFQFTEITPRDIRKHLGDHGVSVRVG